MTSFHAREKLPQGYRLKERIDLTRSKKQLRIVIGISIGWIVAGIAAGFLLQPKLHLLVSGGVWMALFRLFMLCIAIVLYVVGHEAVHGALMWLFSRSKPRFGFTLMYAYAGSRMYFGKYAYLSIALAPVVLWGAALTALALYVPADWFWVIWGVQLTNLSGAAGDFYVFWRVLQMPSGILVQDSGAAMTLWNHA